MITDFIMSSFTINAPKNQLVNIKRAISIPSVDIGKNKLDYLVGERKR